MKSHLKIGLFFALLIAFAFNSYAQNVKSSSAPDKSSLNRGWRFHQGDIAFPVIKGHTESYTNAKAGRANGAAAPAYNDRSWRVVNLPQDWAIENPVDSNENIAQGYRKRGIGWYRRYLKLEEKDKEKHLELQFEGISTHATVWVNGTLVYRNWSGYTSFYIDITPLAKFGDEINTIAIRVDATPQEGWWYEGAGIYRNTWLVKRSPLHIITDGVFAHPVKDMNGEWHIPAEVTVENVGEREAPLTVEMQLVDNNNRTVATGIASGKINALQTLPLRFDIQVKNPELWSPENPILYKVITQLRIKGLVMDSLHTYCGFRTIRFDPSNGLYVNDKPLKIKGVCNHQDHAGLGVAVPVSIMEFRLRKLKEMGVNAYRCAHHAPAKELLDICDRIGIMVMDENRNFNSSPDYMAQLSWLIRRDRNHPSVILWSVFNEEPMQGTKNGFEMVRRMRAEVKRLDSSRAVTAAMNGGFFTPENVAQAVDVVGFNYQIDSYDAFHQANPTLPLTSSEDASGLMTRGEYQTDTSKNTADAYDTQSPPWGATHRNAWKAVAERPYLAGAFVWTGFDYHGEPTPYQWPSVSSNFGIMDLCGFPKTAYYIHKAQWLPEQHLIHIAPHWNWPVEMTGKKIKVMVISNAETVKLFLNDKLIGAQTADKYEMNFWEVPFKAGKLEARGFRNGKEVSRYQVSTTGLPYQINLIPDRSTISGNGIDAVPIIVQVLDKKRRAVPTAQTPITFTVSGGGKIIGLGNGNPNSHEPSKGNQRKLFNGLAQVIVQGDDVATDGAITIVASAAGLKSAELIIPVTSRSKINFVPVTEPSLLLENWLLSAMTDSKPDPRVKIAENDMNSWEPTTAGKPIIMNGQYVMYRTVFKEGQNPMLAAKEIIFKNVSGKAEIWADDLLIMEKKTDEIGDVKIDLKNYQIRKSITVLIQKSLDSTSGLTGVVEVF